MPEFLKNPLCYVAMGLVGAQFVAGAVLDLVLGMVLVAMIAFSQKG